MQLANITGNEYFCFIFIITEFNNSNVGINSNWELLNPHGYRFFLPGSIGLAWTEPSSTINSNSQVSCISIFCYFFISLVFKTSKYFVGTV